MIIYPLKSSIAFNILGLNIHYYGIILAFAIFLGITLIYKFLKSCDNSDYANVFIDNCSYIVLFAIIGARMFYVLGNFSYYKAHINEIIMINHGGISIFGAILFGILAIYLISKINKISCLTLLDVSAVVMPLCQAIGRWGNYFNQEAYGAPTNSFIKLYVDYSHRFIQFKNIEYYHPAFLYESILDFILFLVLFYFFKKNKNKKLKSSAFVCIYLMAYSVIRIFVESIRIDSILNVGSVPVAIIISAMTFLISAIALIKLNK